MAVKFRDMELDIKEKLSFAESMRFVNGVVANVVDVESGAYYPIFYNTSLISNFLTIYGDVKEINLDEIYINQKEYMGLIEKILKFKEIDTDQYMSLKDCINEEIEFKKLLIINNNSSVEKLVKDLLNEQIENVKLQKESTKELSEMYKAFTKDDMNAFAESLNNFNSNFNNPEFQKQLVNALVKFNNKAKPQDRKKSQTKITKVGD